MVPNVCLPSDIRRITSTLCAHRKQTERWTYSRDLDQFIFFLPPLEVRQRLIDRFFADTNPYLIFMNRKLVEDISSACADPSLNLLSDLRLPHASTRHRQNERAVMLLLAVIATGINHLEQPFQGLDTSIDYKQLTVDLLAQLGDHSTLETVQVLLMLTWKEEGCSHSEQAWVHLGNLRSSVLALIGRTCNSGGNSSRSQSLMPKLDLSRRPRTKGKRRLLVVLLRRRQRNFSPFGTSPDNPRRRLRCRSANQHFRTLQLSRVRPRRPSMYPYQSCYKGVLQRSSTDEGHNEDRSR